MTAAWHYLGQMTEAFFESQMRRAAHRIEQRHLLFRRQSA
jgi:hypothetical protein